MTTFKIQKQSVINENYQGYDLTGFSIHLDNEENCSKIVDTFIHSPFFTEDKKSDDRLNKGYLSQIFAINKIDVSNFKKMTKSETLMFLVDFLNDPSWEDDRKEFATLLDKYFEVHKTLSDKEFYILNKDWFDKDSEILNPVHWIFTYYFIIIHIDNELQTLTVTEWTYD